MKRIPVKITVYVAVPDGVNEKQAKDYVLTTLEEVLLEVPFNLDGSLNKESIEAKVREGMTIYDYS